jgi:hypothetical protein
MAHETTWPDGSYDLKNVFRYDLTEINFITEFYIRICVLHETSLTHWCAQSSNRRPDIMEPLHHGHETAHYIGVS